ncbi:Regucalcin [Gryllus bimaculatus]|nr:Regucalcin [Gryllus bimaculatus]
MQDAKIICCKKLKLTLLHCRTMSSATVEVVSRKAILGEGPHWDEVENVLYFVDIKGKEVRRYDPSSKTETAVKIDEGTISLVVPVDGQKDKFIISVGRNISILTWDGKSEKPSNLETIAEVDDEEGKRENRLNDGKADPSGRLWAGTMGYESGPNMFTQKNGALFSLTKSRTISKHISGITCSNGLAWTQDNKIMYYIDSLTYKVEAYDFDIEKGIPTNRRTAFDFKANSIEGLPDGMTIDSNGKLWVACFDGHQVIQVDPENGKLLQRFPLPSPKITSVVFGGPNLDELYVTSASIDLSPEELAKYPTAGCTYHIKGINAKGLPMNRVKM